MSESAARRPDPGKPASAKPAPTKPTSAKPASAKPAGARPASGKPSPAKAPSPQPVSREPVRAKPGTEDTVVRSPLPGRIGQKLTQAAEEHRATASMQPSAPGKKQPRRARLRLTRVDPWSVMKASFLLSIAFGVVMFVAVLIIWTVLGAAGVWDSINSTVASVVEADSPSDFDITDYLGMSRVLGFTVLVAAIDVILLTAIATLGAFLYNMAAALLGGVEVTLAEEDR